MTPPRFAVVAARFNPEVTERLLKSCLAALAAAGVPAGRVRVVRVPGAFEIPWAAQELALRGGLDAVICLGAILRGRTPQNDYLSLSVFEHLHAVSLKTRVPCILGVITPKTQGQALARTRGSMDRGREAALAALAMAGLKKSLGGR